MIDATETDPNELAVKNPNRVRSKVFLSYSHKDKDLDWFKDVKEYLKQLDVGGTIELWNDEKITAGDDWLAEIEANLRAPVAAVFVVTPTFINSNFISREEVPKLLDRLKDDGLIVHALIGKLANWEEHPIGEYLSSKQLIHSPERTLEAMDEPERHKCLHQLVKQIREDVGVHRGRYGHDHRVALMDEIDNQIQGDLKEEVAGGDTTIIYRAREGTRDVAVKAMVSRNISDEGQRELRAELEKCRGLQSPVFIPIHEMSFENGLAVATANWVPGQNLRRFIKRFDTRQEQNWPERAVAIVLKLAGALAEGRRRQLRYLNINPSHILLHQNEPRIYPIDFSSWQASTAHSQGALSFTFEMLEYIAPEYLTKAAARKEAWLSGEQIEANEMAMSKRADQYSLGMLALALLEGGPPVRVCTVADVRQLLEFHAEPRRYRYDGEAVHRGDQEWQRRLPGLARVIWKMLSVNPEDRWENMASVADQLQIVLTTLADVGAHVSEAKEYYTRCIRENNNFYQTFYENLFRLSPDVKGKFADVDMAGQRKLLDGALERLLNYRPNQCEPTTLTEIAQSHQKLQLSEEHFENFGLAFLKTLAETPEINSVTSDAWEAVLWPGLEYMKANASGH